MKRIMLLIIVIILCFVTAFILLCRFFDGIFIASQCGEGCKLSCAVPHRHLRVTLRDVMRQIDDIVVIIHKL